MLPEAAVGFRQALSIPPGPCHQPRQTFRHAHLACAVAHAIHTDLAVTGNTTPLAPMEEAHHWWGTP